MIHPEQNIIRRLPNSPAVENIQHTVSYIVDSVPTEAPDLTTNLLGESLRKNSTLIKTTVTSFATYFSGTMAAHVGMGTLDTIAGTVAIGIGLTTMASLRKEAIMSDRRREALREKQESVQKQSEL